MLVTVFYVLVSFYHPVYVEMEVLLWHSTQNLLVPREPDESLFTAHCVIICWVLFFEFCWVVLDLAPLISVIPNVQHVYYFLDISPNMLQISCII